MLGSFIPLRALLYRSSILAESCTLSAYRLTPKFVRALTAVRACYLQHWLVDTVFAVWCASVA
jgi:hypothetical protein